MPSKAGRGGASERVAGSRSAYQSGNQELLSCALAICGCDDGCGDPREAFALEELVCRKSEGAADACNLRGQNLSL
jgi:hypothetical protein